MSTENPTAFVAVKRRRSKAWRKFGNYALLTLIALAFFAPVYYLIIGSFKPSDKVLDGFAGFLPTNLTFDNYVNMFNALNSTSTGYLWKFMANSLIISLGIVVFGLIVNSMAAYSFARLTWRGRDKIFLLVIALVIVPFEAVAIPLLYMLNGMRDSLLIQILPFVANAFSIYLFYTFFIGMNRSIEEAAGLDGLGPFAIFFRIVVPNSKPVFSTVAILTFLTAWGQFLWPSLVISDPSTRPLPLEISVFSAQQPVDWGVVFAFGVVLILPVLIFFLIFQRFFIQSVASSAVKG